VPRSHPFSGRERLQKVVSLGSPKCDRVQARRAVPPEHEEQEPRAEAAVGVVEDGPAAFAGRAGRALSLSVVCHVDTNNATRQQSGRRAVRFIAATGGRAEARSGVPPEGRVEDDLARRPPRP
jgi:hypothetical protein